MTLISAQASRGPLLIHGSVVCHESIPETASRLIGTFKGGISPNLAANKFHERPSGASRMQENLLVAAA